MNDVATANLRFYEAHEARDLALMATVWESSDRVVCIHPGWPILRGWEAVENSWRQIFSGPGRNQFVLTNDRITVVGDTAWVTLDENLIDESAAGTIAATNLYSRESGHWQLVLHHGSPVMTR